MRNTARGFLVLILTFGLCRIAAAETATYESRGVQVPATVALPEGEGPFPLVILAHGHGGARDDNYGFNAIPEALRARGIASIRMDFPGCGESTESFRHNTLRNMKQDVRAAAAFAMERYPIDANRMGIFGFSMGGRVALELLADPPGVFAFSAAVLLAPAASTANLQDLFGGAEDWAFKKTIAEERGCVLYGGREVAAEWFADLEATENPAQAAAALFDGRNMLVIYGLDDTVIAPHVCQEVAAAFGSAVIDATGDGHSYGFYSDRTDVLDIVVEGTADFFEAAFTK